MHRVGLIALAVLGLCVSAERTSDPRCAGYRCITRNKPYDLSFNVDPTTCNNGTYCPQCLTGPTWAQRISDLGGLSARTLQFSLLFNNWLSAELTDTIAKIILNEVLGYATNAVPHAIDGWMDVLCCDEMLVELEKWPSGRFPSDEGYFTISGLPVGYEGGSNLFVPDYMAASLPMSTFYNSYKYLADYRNVLPRAFSTNCSLLLVDPALGCVEGNYVCNKNTWTNTSCVQGRYVPPQCMGANSAYCQEIFLADPGWDAARFEALVKNNNLNFTIAYLGGGGLRPHLDAMYARRENFMFYWWEPDPLPSSFNARPVNFEPNSFGCEQRHAQGNGDPTLSGYDCAYPKALLMKYARRAQLEQDLSFKHFFESFQLTGADMATMLGQHTAAGGNRTVYDLSCAWVQGNFGKWQSWIRPADPPVAVAASSNSNLLPAILAPCLIVVAGVAGAIIFVHVRAARAVKHAPKKPPLALVFTDIESSTKLWENHGTDMKEAVELHHAVIRACIEKHNAYEVKVIGDAFMIAAMTPLDATMMCFDIQASLVDAKWPASLEYWIPDGAPTQPPTLALAKLAAQTADASSVAEEPVWKGLRVRMGVHLCQEVEPKFDVIHQRYDYYGHDVNMSARVQAAAQGGQILCSEETLAAIRRDPDFEATLANEFTVQKVTNGIELKGVAEPVALFNVLPMHLSTRVFHPLDNAPGDTEQHASLHTVSDIGSQSSLSSLQNPGSNVATAAVLSVFDCLAPDVKKRVIDACSKSFGVRSMGSDEKNVRRIAHAIAAMQCQERRERSVKETTLMSPKAMPGAVTDQASM